MVARVRIVLGTGAQHLDRPRDASDRIAQLVCGVGHELALRELAAKPCGPIAHDGQHGVLGRQIADPDRVDPIAHPQTVVLGGAALGGAHEPGNQHVDCLSVGPDQGLGGPIREPHLPLRADDHDRVVERVEDRRQTIPLRRQRPERLAQRDPHRLQSRPEIGDLVASACPLEGLVEPSFRDSSRAASQPFDSRGDRRGDQKSDHDRDRDRDRGRRQTIPAQGVDGSRDLLGPLGPSQHRARDTTVAKDRRRDHADDARQLINRARPPHGRRNRQPPAGDLAERDTP